MQLQHSQRSIAVVGVPNVGKSTLFNALTGLQQRVGNFPGVTIEPMVGSINERGESVTLIDLPGIYSLDASSEDEVLSVDVLRGVHRSIPKPDAVLLVMNASNPDKCLALHAALTTLNIPMIIAVTMIDDVKASGGVFDDIALFHELGVRVMPVVGRKGLGVADLKSALVDPSAALIPRAVDLAQTTGAQPSTGSTEARVAWAAQLVGRVVIHGKRSRLTEKLDNILLHPVFGTLAFVVVMALFFQAIFSWSEPLMNLIESGIYVLRANADANITHDVLRSFVSKGLLAGVGAVIVFLPQILILNILITVLEECGYMARAAFLVDRFMGLFGLQGRSFIPLLGSFACAVPGIMSARIIPSYKDRIATIMAAPLMTCSARLPVYTLLIGALIPSAAVFGIFSLQSIVMASLFVAGALSGLLIALVLKRTMFKGDVVPFLIEFPPYRAPSLHSLYVTVVNRTKDFLTTAGTVILAFSIALWILTELPRTNVGSTSGNTAALRLETERTQLDSSYAASIGRAVQPVFAPLGFDWRITLGVLGSYAARETFVSVMGQVYAADVSASDVPLREVIHRELPLPVGLSLLAYYVYALQCVSTMAVMKRETGTWKWPALSFAITFVLAYAAAWLTFIIASS
ncbi:MAG: ferrous iron transporter B [bacterium]|nr:ferrous iron transporter B [bacterium]